MIGIGLPISIGAQAAGGQGGFGGLDYYIDGVTGDNGNAGTSKNKAFRTPEGIVSPFSGMRVGIANGTDIRKGFFNRGVFTDVTFVNYFANGTAALPLIRCDALIPADEWTSVGGSVYSVALTLPDFGPGSAYPRLWGGATRFKNVASQGAVVAGSCYFSDNHGEITLYMRAADSSDPRVNGVAYSYAAQMHGVELQGARGKIIGIRSRRNLGNSGSIICREVDSLIANCEMLEGANHNCLIGSGRVTGCHVADAYNGEGGSVSYLVGFLNNGEGHSLEFDHNFFTSNASTPLASGACAIIWHNAEADTGFYDRVSIHHENWSNIQAGVAGEVVNVSLEIDTIDSDNVLAPLTLKNDCVVKNFHDDCHAGDLGGRTCTPAVDGLTIRFEDSYSCRDYFANAQFYSSGTVHWEFERFKFGCQIAGGASFSYCESPYGSYYAHDCDFDQTNVGYAFILGRGAQDVIVDSNNNRYSKEGTNFEFNRSDFVPYPTVSAWKLASGQDADSTVGALTPWCA